jgi:excisionase family DNA binding protein
VAKTAPSLGELREGARATLSVEETAVVLGISLGSARKAIRNNELPALRLGSRYLVPVAKLLALLGEEER